MRQSFNGSNRSSPRGALDVDKPIDDRRGSRKDSSHNPEQFVIPRRRGTASIFTSSMNKSPRFLAPISPRASVQTGYENEPKSPRSSRVGQKSNASRSRRTSAPDDRSETLAEVRPPRSARSLQPELMIRAAPTLPVSPHSRPKKVSRNDRCFTFSEFPEQLSLELPAKCWERSRTVPVLPDVRVDSLRSIQSADTFSDLSENETGVFISERESRPTNKSLSSFARGSDPWSSDDLASWSDDDSEISSIKDTRKCRRNLTCSTLPPVSVFSDESLQPRIKSHQDIDREFQELFGENPDWDPEVGVEPPQIEIHGDSQISPQKRAPRRTSTMYVDAVLGAEVVDQIMSSEREKEPSPEPEPEVPLEAPKMSLNAVLTSLLFVRQRVARLRRTSVGDTTVAA